VLFEAFALPLLDPAAGFEAAFLDPPLEAPLAAFAPVLFLAPPELVLLVAFPLPPELLAALLLLPAPLVPPDFAPADFALPDPVLFAALDVVDFEAADFPPLAEPGEPEDLALLPPLAEAPDFPPVAVLTAAPAAPTTAPDAAPARISPATSFALSMMVSSTPLPLDAFLDLPPVDFDFADPFFVAAMSSLLKLISKLLRAGSSKLCANISHYRY
jgi:hypothetical protein